LALPTGSAPRWDINSDGRFINPSDGTNPETTGGFLSSRNAKRIVIAAPDGHVNLQPFDALGSMRRWADAATNPHWTPSLP
jgi:hypothetical protein